MSDQPQKTKQQLLDELESIMSMLDDDSVIPTLDTVVEPYSSELQSVEPQSSEFQSSEFQSSEPQSSNSQGSVPSAEPDRTIPIVNPSENVTGEIVGDKSTAEETHSPEPIENETPVITTNPAAAISSSQNNQPSTSPEPEAEAEVEVEVELEVKPKIEAKVEAEVEVEVEAEPEVKPEATKPVIQESPKSTEVDYSQSFKSAMLGAKATGTSPTTKPHQYQSNSNPFKPSLLKGESLSPGTLPGQQQLFGGTPEPEETITAPDKFKPVDAEIVEHAEQEALVPDKPNNPFKSAKLSATSNHDDAAADINTELNNIGLDDLDLDSIGLDNVKTETNEQPQPIAQAEAVLTPEPELALKPGLEATPKSELDSDLEPTIDFQSGADIEPAAELDLELPLEPRLPLPPIPQEAELTLETELTLEREAPEIEASEPKPNQATSTTHSIDAANQNSEPSPKQVESVSPGLMPLTASAAPTPHQPDSQAEEQQSDTSQIVDDLVAQYLPQIEAELRQRLLAALDDDELDF